MPRRAGFCVLSLEDWLEACDAAGVTSVPTREVARFGTGDLLNFDREGPHQERIAAAYANDGPSPREPRHQDARRRCCGSPGLWP